MDRPMPRLPPVMTTIFSAKSWGMIDPSVAIEEEACVAARRARKDGLLDGRRQ
jgi:hypothetical protein